MKIKNATIKEVYEKVLQDENSFAFFAIEDDGTFHGFCHGDYFQTFWRPSGCQGLPAMYQV